MWLSHEMFPSSSVLSSSSSKSFCSSRSSTLFSSSPVSSVFSSTTISISWLRAEEVQVSAGTFLLIGTDPEACKQLKVARSQVVPEGQQCSWSSQHTAFWTKKYIHSTHQERSGDNVIRFQLCLWFRKLPYNCVRQLLL